MTDTPLQQSAAVLLCWRRVLTVALWDMGLDWHVLTGDEAIAYIYTWPRTERDAVN